MGIVYGVFVHRTLYVNLWHIHNLYSGFVHHSLYVNRSCGIWITIGLSLRNFQFGEMKLQNIAVQTTKTDLFSIALFYH